MPSSYESAMPCRKARLATISASSARSRRGNVMLFILLCILAGLAVILILSLIGPSQGSSHGWVGQPVPNVQLHPLLNAEEPLGTSEMIGKVSLVNFWGPWCPPCLAEFPDLLKIRQNFSDETDFQLVSIAADGGWQPAVPKELPDETEETRKQSEFQEDVPYLEHESQLILAKYNSDLPVYVDLKGELRAELMKIAPYTGYPTTFLVDRDGQIEAVWVGYAGDMSDVSKKIRELLDASQSDS